MRCEQTPRTMKLRLARADRNVEGLRRLGVAEPVDADEHEHVACAVGQSGNRRFEIERWRGIDRPPVDLVRFRVDGDFHLLTQPAASGQHGIHGDAMQPCGERASTLEPLEATPGLDEGFLDTIFGRLPMTGEAQAQSVDAPDMSPVQALEGNSIPGRGGGHRAGVIGRFGRRRVSGIEQHCRLGAHDGSTHLHRYQLGGTVAANGLKPQGFSLSSTGMFPGLHYRDRGSYDDRIIPAADLPELPPPPYRDGYPLKLPDGDWALLPFLALPPAFDTAIVYLCITANSFALEDRLSSAMADLARPFRADIVVGMPTLGMVLAASVGRKLGHERYVPLSYSRKFWFEDELSTPVNSITTPVQPKTVYIDPRLIERLEGKRVLLVEDVISTGGTVAAELALMQKLGADVVGVITAIRETRVWIDKLAAIDPRYPTLVRSPIRCPLFRRSAGGWVPDASTLPD